MENARARKVVEYHDDGKISAEMSFLDDELDGVHRTFAEDGATLVSESHFRRGVLHGKSLTFHPDGRVAQSMEFADGVLNGLLEEFDEAGHLRYRAHFRDGLQHGVISVLDASGQEVVHAEYREGELVVEPVDHESNAAPGDPCGHCGHNH